MLRYSLGGFVGLLVLAFAVPAMAHVAFDSPADNATLIAGETVTLTWSDVIPHNTDVYDIDFLLEPGPEGIPVVHDLPATEHSYEWLVPDTPCTACLLHITQHNIDYQDFGDPVPITILRASSPPDDPPEPDPGPSTEARSSSGCSVASANSGGRCNTAWLTLAAALALHCWRRRFR
jgi:hypothetical protein